MAPMDRPDHNLVEQQVKDVIQDLFQVMVQVSTYDQAGKPSRDVLAAELTTLSSSLRAVHRTATASLPPPSHNPNNQPPPSSSSSSSPLPMIPDVLIQYVEAGRNPDIYTREFVELVRRMNQLARGKERAFAAFRDVLAREMAAALPELGPDVARVLDATGGEVPIPPVVAAAGTGTAAGGGGGAEGEKGAPAVPGGGGEGAGEKRAAT